MFNGDKIIISLLPDHYISPEEALSIDNFLNILSLQNVLSEHLK